MAPNTEQFSEMEIDAIGEILNISLGSSATSISSMLDKRVNITTPRVQVMDISEFHFESYEPAIGVEITYIEGLTGTNVMIWKESDVKVIVGLLLGSDYVTDDFVMDEMSISAICEVMNQMMGASSTALSQFLDRTINISTPSSFPIDDSESFKEKYYGSSGMIVSVYFKLMIEDLVNSEFISVIPIELAKELVSMFNNSMGEEAPAEPAPAPAPAPAPVQAAPQPVPVPQAAAPQPAPVQQAPAPAARAPQPPVVHSPQPQVSYEVHHAAIPSFETEQIQLSGDESNNLSLIMSVPLEITVEIGQTKRQIKEILDFSPGTIVELNKQAGSPVDIYVNGQAIAKGDVVVVDDYYGVRITEILSNSEIINVI